jgi:uncharacterized membrane protein
MAHTQSLTIERDVRSSKRPPPAPLTRTDGTSARPAANQTSARALGWFSIGLGLSELLMPETMARTIGFRRSPLWLQVMGAREIATGIGILAAQRPGPGHLQLRVVGDAIDLALLASAWQDAGRDRDRLAIATAAVAGVTVLDVLATRQLASQARQPLELQSSLAVQGTPDVIYRRLRSLKTLPEYLSQVDTVELQGEEYFELRSRTALGGASRFKGRIIEDVPDRRIAWELAPDSPLRGRGRIELSQLGGDRGTLLRATITLEPGVPQLAAPLARVLGKAPEKMILRELRRFKQLIETGEVPTTRGQPSGRRSLVSRHLP